MPDLILDLDQTIVDSSSAESFRKNRQWSNVYSLIPSFTVYNGLLDLFQYIRDNNLKVCVVTTSPEVYCRKVLTHWAIPFDFTVCYHDVSFRKPHPEAFHKAIALLGGDHQNIISLGDRAIDIEASRKANVKSIGCLWGTLERDLILSAQPDFLAESPAHALGIIRSF